MTYIPAVFDFPAINKRDEEIKAEKAKILQDSKLPEVGEAAIGWPYTYGTPVDTDYVC